MPWYVFNTIAQGYNMIRGMEPKNILFEIATFLNFEGGTSRVRNLY